MNKKPSLFIDLDDTIVLFKPAFKKDVKKQVKTINRLIRLKKYREEDVEILQSLCNKLNNLLEDKIKLSELHLTEEEKRYFTYPQSRKKFLFFLEPIPGAKENIEKLKEFFDVKILTKPSYMNPGCYTEKRLWVEWNYDLEMCKHLYFAPDKSYILGDYLVDDNLWEGFTGIQLQYGTEGLENWDKVYDKLIELYENSPNNS